MSLPELFITTEDIPAELFSDFVICNEAPHHWMLKKEFYSLKIKILLEYGQTDNHDLQIIQRKCNACNGTGSVYGCRCRKCQEGIYRTDYVALARYVLNEQLFYIPDGLCSEKTGKFYRNNCEGDTPIFRQVIKGMIEPKLKNVFPNEALLRLARQYNTYLYDHIAKLDDLPF